MTVRAAVVVAGLVLCSGGASAQDVVFEVQGKDKVLGTLRPADEREVIVGRLERGTTLKAAAKASGKGGPAPSIEVLADDVPAPDAVVLPKGRGVALQPYVVPATAVYKVVVSGDGTLDGDYQASVAWTPAKSFSATGLVSAGEQTFAFAAPRGATVAIALAAEKGSPFVPDLLQLEGPDAVLVPLAGGGKASKVALPVRGDWLVRFRSGGPDGAYRIAVKVKARKPRARTTDIRDGALAGLFGDGPVVVGAVVEPDVGGTVEVTDGDSPIAGSSVVIPPDALGQATSVFVAESAPYFPEDGALPAGPAVEFGPSGTKFAEGTPATVTIPFDANDFPGGTQSLVVYVKDADGEVVAVPGPYTFGAGTVTFTTSHFSTFLAATGADRGPPQGSFVAFGVRGMPTRDLDGELGVVTGFLDLQNESVALDLQDTRVAFSRQQAPTPSATYSFPSRQVTGSSLDIADSVLELRDDGGATVGVLRRGVNGDVLLMEHPVAAETGAIAFFRRVDARPTLNTLAGRWHAIVWEFRAERAAAGATQRALAVVGDVGTATLTADGQAKFQFDGTVTRRTLYPSGDWERDTGGVTKFDTTIAIDPDFIPVLDFGRELTVGLTPVLGGDVLFGTMQAIGRDGSVPEAQVGLLVLVRESKGKSVGGVAGSYFDHAGGADLLDAEQSPAADLLGLRWRADTNSTTIRADRGVRADGLHCLSGYLTQTLTPETFTEPTLIPGDAAISLSPNGRFSVPRLGLAGAISRDGTFAVYLVRSGTGMTLGFASRRRDGRT